MQEFVPIEEINNETTTRIGDAHRLHENEVEFNSNDVEDLERPHQAEYLTGERYSWILVAGAAISERPPVSGMGKKGAGPGIWEESIRYFVLGCRALPANTITQILCLKTYSSMSRAYSSISGALSLGLYLPGLVGFIEFAGHPPLCRGCHRGDYAQGGARASGDALRGSVLAVVSRTLYTP